MADTKICPYCGGEILAVAKKCKHCGQWLEEGVHNSSQSFIRCPICDEDIPSDSVICPECGEPLPNKQIKPNESPSNSAKKKDYKWLIILIVALLIGGLFLYNNLDFGGKTTYDYSRTNTHQERSLPAPEEEYEETAPEQIIPAPTDDILEKWDVAHNMKAIDKMTALYADTVDYYQSTYSLAKVLDSKQKLFDQNPLFHQECSNVHIYPVDDISYRFEFEKNVWIDYSDDEYKIYSSYLIVTYIDSEWKITAEGDSVS